MPARQPPSLDAEVARRVRALRTERHMSQPKLAEEMERLGFRWTGVTVAEIEGRRQRAVSVAELLGLAQVFDVGVRSLLGASSREPPTGPGANRLQVTPKWVVERRDVSSLLGTGRRISAMQARLTEQLAEVKSQIATYEELRSDRIDQAERLAEILQDLQAQAASLEAAAEEVQ